MVKLGYEDVVQEFTIEHAQRILDVKHPQNPWKLKDEEYKIEQGKIVKA